MTAAQAAATPHTITVELSDDLYAAAQEAVKLRLASSQADFVLGAVRQRARELRHARMRRLAAEAMADPGFVADIQDTTAELRHADRQRWSDESQP